MKMKNYCLLFFSTLLLFACNSKTETDKRVTEMEKYLDAQSKYYRFNGNVLVAENGKTILQRSYGYADLVTNRPLNDSTVFELASVSKQFTATAILLLKDQGKLKLTDSLRQYFPELPYSGINIYQLLTHTSGLPEYEAMFDEKWDRSKVAFNKDLISLLAEVKSPLLFEPGSRWKYSNTGYALLASIVEKVSGHPFSKFMTENIFQPLQMNNTRIYNTRRSSRDTIANYAYGFIYEDSLKKYLLPDSINDLKFVIYLDGIQGDGVVNSTTADLLKWDRAVKEHRLLKEETQNEMLKGQALADTVKKNYYGFGVFTGKTELGNLITHSGGWPGYVTFLARDIDKDQTYIVLSNNNSSSPSISTALQHIMNGKPVTIAYEHKEISIDTAAMELLIGKYKGPIEISIERSGKKLYRVSASGQKVELKPESATKFFYADGSDRQFEFELNAQKKVVKAWIINYGVRTDFQKMN